MAPKPTPSSSGYGPGGSAPAVAAPPDTLDLSIARQVQKIGEGFPATDLIKVLLRHIAIDASKFVRDVKSSNQIYYRALMVYNAIQDLMTKVNDSTTIEWTAFDQYTVAIPPLESILLEFYTNYPEDKKREHLPPTTGVEDAVMFIQRWENDRTMLAKALSDLSGDKFTILSGELKALLMASREEPRAFDDMDTIRALNTVFTTNALTDRDVIQQRGGKFLSNVRREVRAITGKLVKNPAAGATSAIAIKILMIVYIPFAFISSSTTSTEWKDYLRGTLIWQSMER
ncbi:hypothetical protein GALMADRAFT_1219103 [Galerina marginata CBS 339.88]|uniref:Uncharacterized protein n=1 Tax=Galerina marginata (strain CBS 339.88) TaxID=685588 RepID=A0A067SD87_GALM3|nr:hypothetical protein GALMADRAFT_1219103 [Galerina marginata CBS 339.88]